MRFPQEFLDELRSRNDIEEVIGRYVEIRHRGSRTPVCLCPFHSERTPSFTIYTNTQSYYCFGCQAGGDVITFVKNIERLDYQEAVKSLAERSGLAMPEDAKNDKAYELRRRCYAANREAGKFFYSVLKSEAGKKGYEYFRSRGLSDETITHFGLGFAPDSWDALLQHMQKKGYSKQELVAFGLAATTQKGSIIDKFRNRVIFPVIDLRSNVIAFTGRVLDDSKPKYMNTTDTVVYKKSREMYALNFAKNNNDGRLILCEGNMDVIAMHQAGFTNAVAGMGTAFTREQVSLLSRYATELLLCFDNDEAGKKATSAALKTLASSSLKLRVISLSGGKDADEIIKTKGIDYMRALIEGASNNTEFELSRIKAKYDTGTEDGRLSFINEAIPVLAQLRNAVEADLYVTKLANETGVQKQAIEQQLKKQKNYRKKTDDNKLFESAVSSLLGTSSQSPNPQVRQYPNAVRAEETLLATLLKAPDFLKKLGSSLNRDLFVTDLNKRIFGDFSDRISAGRPIEFIEFASNDDDSDVAYLSYLTAKSNTVQCSLSECDECIKVLIFEKNKQTTTNVSGMSNEDYLKAFRAAAEKKKNGGN